MWPESSSVKAVNLVRKICYNITEIMNYFKRIVFYWRTLVGLDWIL